MQQTFYIDERQVKITLGSLLGAGGEGNVYEVNGNPDIVAKIYHKPPDLTTISKLREMVAKQTDELIKLTAWPLSTLSKDRNQVVGFIMPKVVGYESIHKLYGPSDRKQLFPKADWHFLVHVARNLCAAFASVHKSGYVIGDVNQGNIVVSKEGIVRLIDCDSFQVSSQINTYLCEVGVSHFTSPELLKMGSFKGVVRTQNHDNFGLAVLCFHLLFMGRHPFSGVSLKNEELTIEQSIKNFQFAYSKSAHNKGMSTPPKTMSLDILPYRLANLFEGAFAEFGSLNNARPTAIHWVSAIDEIKEQIVSCQTNRMHKYYSKLSGCPWCYAENIFGAIFFIDMDSVANDQNAHKNTSSSILIAYNYALLISSVVKDHGVPTQFPVKAQVKASGWPPPKVLHWLCRLGIVIFGVLIWPMIGYWRPEWLVWTIAGSTLAALVIPQNFFESDDYSRIKRHRRDVKQKWSNLNAQWNQSFLNSGLDAIKYEIINLKQKYEAAEKQVQSDRNLILQQQRDHHVMVYLRGFAISEAKILLIGRDRLAALKFSGVITAADVSLNNLEGIPGFGRALVQKIIDWRWSLEFKFKLNPSVIQSVDQSLNQLVVREKLKIANQMAVLHEQAKRAKMIMDATQKSLYGILYHAAEELAQAEVDYHELNHI